MKNAAPHVGAAIFIMDRKKLRNDIILILAVLIAALAAWGVIALTQRQGHEVLVEIKGSVTASYPLDRDLRIDIVTEDGHMNTLVIEGGRARIEAADCPDKLCVKQRAISKAGESIICLPHKLVIRISGESGVDGTV